MPAANDAQFAGAERGPHVAALARHLAESEREVDQRHRFGNGLERAKFGGKRFHQLAERLPFEFDQPIARADQP